MKPRLLDLFCGAGGCSVGYVRAGFEVVGIDSSPQRRYPFPFCEGDAIELLDCLLRGGYFRPHGSDRAMWLSDFDAIHASPPCQRYSVSSAIHGSAGRHADLVEPVRNRLSQTGKPWVIENVYGAPLHRPIRLCGLMFGLQVIRHRLFEASHVLLVPEHKQHPKHLRTGTLTKKRGGRGNGYSTGEHGLVCVAGNNFVREAGARAMGIDWMNRKELAQAIPPAYTEFIGRQLARLCHDRASAVQ